MKLLAIDTSSVACSVALAYGGEISERYEEQPREHTRLLVPMIESVLQDAGIELAQLDAIVLGNGPGSFIGMRIAASVAQGLAHGAGLGIVPVSSLAAVAAEVFTDRPEEYVAVAQDAHMSEVYFGLFRRDANGLPEADIPERIQAQAAYAVGIRRCHSAVSPLWIARAGVEIPKRWPSAHLLCRPGAQSLRRGEIGRSPATA